MPLQDPASVSVIDHVFGRPRSEAAVAEVMTPGVITVMETTMLGQVTRALARHGVDGVLVVGTTTGAPLGWVTARGLLAHLGEDRFTRRAAGLVTEPPLTVLPSETLARAADMLLEPGVSRLLVSG